MDYFLDAYRKYADFTGRATRTQFWMFFLFYIIAAIVTSIIDNIIGMPILGGLLALGSIVPSIAIGARRLHDTSRSGWWQLLSFIPLIGGIILLVFFVQDSHPDNEYGPNPKGVGA